MDIRYNGEHSITFIDYNESTSTIVSVKRTWMDLHLIPEKRPSVVFKKPSYSLVDIPGTSKTVDITSYMLGGQTYAMRTGSWTFYINHEQWGSWIQCKKELESYFNGKALYCILEDEHEKAYKGRFKIDSFQTGSTMSKVSIGYELFNGDLENDFHYLRRAVKEYSVETSTDPLIISDPNWEPVLRENLDVKVIYDDDSYDTVDWYNVYGYNASHNLQNITLYISTLSTFHSETINFYISDVASFELDSANAELIDSETVDANNWEQYIRNNITVTVTHLDGTQEECDWYTLSGYVSGQVDQTITVTIDQLNSASFEAGSLPFSILNSRALIGTADSTSFGSYDVVSSKGYSYSDTLPSGKRLVYVYKNGSNNDIDKISFKGIGPGPSSGQEFTLSEGVNEILARDLPFFPFGSYLYPERQRYMISIGSRLLEEGDPVSFRFALFVYPS